MSVGIYLTVLIFFIRFDNEILIGADSNEYYNNN